MKYAYLAFNLALIGILAIIVLKSGCDDTKVEGNGINIKKYNVVKYVTDTQYVEKKITIIKNGKDIHRDTIIYQPVPYMDSIQLQEKLKEYYAKNVLNDTIKVDSGYVYIKDTIQMNKILNRRLSVDMKYPVITKEVFYKENKRVQVYAGANGNVSKDGNFLGAGVGLILKTKSDRLYGIGAGFDQAKNLNINGSIYVKL
jgi:hypothetical protein